ncbi:hypothetical protein AB0J35_57770 [Nonomuraea angiospora]|uniref:hypothetical protein n=1 Tax=Nonomuraea angiospora TaxID=46172 RepID=UPI00343443E7
MADRTVTTRLKLAVAGWTAGKNTVKRDLKDLNTSFKETAGFASGFRKQLEDAVKRLPKIEIDANSSAAEAKFAKLRGELEALSEKTIGVDMDAVDALAELQRLKSELASLEDGASFEVRAGIQQAIADMEKVAAEARRLDGRDIKITIDADTKEALGDITKIHLGLLGLGATVPVVASVAAAAGSMQGAFFAAGAGVQAFGTVATATMERVTAAVDSADFSKLSPEEFQLAQQWQTFSDVYLRWQQSLNPDVVPAISGGLNLMATTLPKLSPLVAGTASSFVGLEKNADRALNGPFWTQFLHNLGVAAPQAVTGFGNSLLNVGTGVAGVINAFLPFTPNVVNPIENASEAFARWGQRLKDSPEFQEFLAYVRENAPEAWELVKNLAKALGNVGEAVLPLGVGSMSGLNLLASILAGMDPDHIRLIALAILAIKTAQAGMQVASFWQDLMGKLDGVGGAADRAKGKLGGLTSTLKAGGMAALVAGAAIAIDTLGDELAGLNPDIDQTAKRMEELAAKGRPASQMLGEFGSNVDTFAGDMARSSFILAPTIGQFEQLGDTVKRLSSDNGITQFGNDIVGAMGNLYSVDQGRQRLENFDQTLTTMVRSGNSEQAARLFDELARQAGLSGDQVDKLKSLLPGYSGAVAAAQQATQPTGDALKDLGNAASTAAGNVDTLRGAIGQLVGLTSNAMSAEINYKRTLDETGKAIKENGQATSTSTEKGRANREALIGLAESANKYRQALIEQGTPLDEVTAKVAGQRQAFITLAEKMGFSKTQANNLATALGLIPENVSSDVKTPGGKEALALIKEYQRKLGELDGKTVNTSVITTYYDRKQSVAKQDRLKAAAGGILRFAEGGIERYASGGMRPMPPSIVSKPTVLFGEGSSGKGATEAFIPYEGKFRTRAVELLGQVADDFGLALYNRNAAKQVDQVAVTVDAASVHLSAGLADTTTALTNAMGATGTVTSAINQLGDASTAMSASWQAGADLIGNTMNLLGTVTSDAVTVMTDSMTSGIDTLAVSIDHLGDVLAVAAGSASASSPSKSSKSSKSSSTKPTSSKSRATSAKKPSKSKSQVTMSAKETRGSIKGGVGATAKETRGSFGGVGATAKETRGVLKPSNMIAGDYGLSGTPEWVSTGAELSMSVPVNSARVSAPRQMSTAYAAAAPPSAGSPAPAFGGTSTISKGGSLVTIQGDLVVREQADADRLSAALYARLGSKGP